MQKEFGAHVNLEITFIFLSLGREDSSRDWWCPAGSISPKSLGEEHTSLKVPVSRPSTFSPPTRCSVFSTGASRWHQWHHLDPGAEPTPCQGLPAPPAPSNFTVQKQRWFFKINEFISPWSINPNLGKRGKRKKKLCKPKTFCFPCIWFSIFIVTSSWNYTFISWFFSLNFVTHVLLSILCSLLPLFRVFEGCLIFMGWMYHSLR